MPNLENAKKALRQAKKRMERNKVIQAEIHSLRVKLRKLVTEKKATEAFELAKTVGKKLDKALAKRILKKNAVARYKSRMMQKIHAVMQK